MIPSLEDYRHIVGDEAVYLIYKKARKLYGKHILHINSTYLGGGVAEMLSSLLPLFNNIGIDAGWRILHGNADFFAITKGFHNALQGGSINFSKMKQRIYIERNQIFSSYTHVDHDCVIIHDPQPLPLIQFCQKRQPWIWRCHIDLSKPNGELWEFLKEFILRYDVAIVSNDNYKQPDLPSEQRVVCPAIDPLSPKNKDLSKRDIGKYLRKFRVPTDKPIVAQVSRFDRWKDPEGVLRVFRRVREVVDCRLVLCGSMAPDDPEGWRIYQKVCSRAKDLQSSGDLVLITSENNILVNALQRTAAVIVQKSIREGFGLTVTEALWKGRPVVASKVGGIPQQIRHGESGYLLDPDDDAGFAEAIVEVLGDPDRGAELGCKGRETVRDRFLITRLLSDYLDVLSEVMLS